MKLKKILCGVLAAATAIGCTLACACSTTTGGGNNVIDDLEGQLTFNEYGEPEFSKKINLNVWSVIEDPDDVYLNKVNRAFNDQYKESNISANIVSKGNSGFYTLLANTVNQDPENAPDVVIFHSERLNYLNKSKLLIPVEEYYTYLNSTSYGESMPFKTSDYLENVISQCYDGGKLCAVPFDMHPGVWYCRQDILHKNGLEVPTNLLELVDVCNKLIQKSKDGTLYTRAYSTTATETQWTTAKFSGAAYESGDKDYCPIVMSSQGGMETGWIPQCAVLQNGGTLCDNKGYPAWNTSKLEDVMQMFRDWQSGEASGTVVKDAEGVDHTLAYEGPFVSPDNDYNQTWAKLASGESIFCFEGSWFIEKRFKEYASCFTSETEDPLTNFSSGNMYALDLSADCASYEYGVGHCVAISKTVTSKAKCVAAAIFAQYLAENSYEYTDGGHLPANKNVLNSQRLKDREYYQKHLVKFGNPEDYRMLGNTQYYVEVYDKLKDVYRDVFTSSKNKESIHTLVDTRYKEALSAINSSSVL